MTGVAPEPSPRFWRHVSISEIWLTLTAWLWGPGLWWISWTVRQAPQFEGPNLLIVVGLIIGTLGAPIALIAFVIRLSRQFSKPAILRLTAHALIVVIAWNAPEPPLRPEQEWQAKRTALQALAEQALASKDQTATNGWWEAHAYQGQVTMEMKGYRSHCIVYSPNHPLDLIQYVNASGPTYYLEKDLASHWHLLRIEGTL